MSRPSDAPESGSGLRWARVRAVRRRAWPPIVRQYEASDCGPAALLTALRQLGGDASLAHVRALAGTDQGGTTLLGMQEAAQALGLEARGARGSYEDLSRVPLPAIVLVVPRSERTHFVVVERVRPHAVRVADPELGRHWMRRADFESIWSTRAALLLRPTPRMMAAPPPGWIGWIRGHLRTGRIWLAQALFLGVAGAALGLLTAVFVQLLVDRLIPGGDRILLLGAAAGLAVVLLARALAGYLRERFLLTLHRRLGLRIQGEVLGRLFRLPVDFFERRSVGDLTARMSDGLRLQAAALETIGIVVIDGMVVVGSLACLLFLARPLGVATLVLLPPAVVALAWAAHRIRGLQRRTLAAHSEVHARFVDTLRGVREFLGGPWARPAFRRNFAAFRELQVEAERLGTLHARVQLGVEVTAGLLVVFALALGALHVMSGRMELGALMAGYALLAGLLPSAQRLAGAPGALQEAAAAAERLQDLLLHPTECGGGALPFRPHREIRLERASWRWPSGCAAVEAVDLVMPRGRVVGLWGPNGAGKSTLVSILRAERTPTSGRLLVDGVSSGSIVRAELRRRIALIPPDPPLFRGTLADNVLLGVREEEALARLAPFEAGGFAAFLARFPQGWATRVGEGGRTLSAGERQVIGALRALVKDPEVLLVDEGLLHADAALSELVRRRVFDFGRGRFLLVVSHDPDLLRCVDHLYRMESGRIVAEGPPARILRDFAVSSDAGPTVPRPPSSDSSETDGGHAA